MYILIPDWVPDEFVPVSAAHAALKSYLKFKECPHTINWLDNSFKKVVVRVNEDQLEHIRHYYGNEPVEITESNLDFMLTAVALRVQPEYPEFMRKYKLWKPKKKPR